MLATPFSKLGGPDKMTNPPNLQPVDVTEPFQVERTAHVSAELSMDPADGTEESAATRVKLRVQNVSENATLILTRVELLDGGGHVIDTFVDRPHALAPMQTAEFFATRRGARFLVTWALLEVGPDPVIEAVPQADDDASRGPAVIERLAEIELFSNETP